MGFAEIMRPCVVAHDDALRHRLDDGGVQDLGLAQPPLGLAPVGDVADEAVHELLAVRALRGPGAVVHPALDAVRPEQPVLDLDLLTGGERSCGTHPRTSASSGCTARSQVSPGPSTGSTSPPSSASAPGPVCSSR